MDTDSFRYVIAISEYKSISAAARKLFITQPALTKHMNKLERTLGAELFERGGVPVNITPAGEVFLEYAKRYMAMEQEMKARMDAVAKQESGTIRIATTSRGGWYLSKHMGEYTQAHPNVRVEMINVDAKNCEEMLVNGLVDVGIYTDPVLSDQIEYVPLKKDPLIFVMHKDNRILEGKDITGNSLDNLLELEVELLRRKDVRFVLSTPQHSMHYSEKAFFERYGIVPESPVYVDYIETRYAFACSGAGVVLVPIISANPNADMAQPVFCVLKGDRLYRHIIIARKKRARMNRPAENFWDQFIELSYSNHEKCS